MEKAKTVVYKHDLYLSIHYSVTHTQHIEKYTYTHTHTHIYIYIYIYIYTFIYSEKYYILYIL